MRSELGASCAGRGRREAAGDCGTTAVHRSVHREKGVLRLQVGERVLGYIVLGRCGERRT